MKIDIKKIALIQYAANLKRILSLSSFPKTDTIEVTPDAYAVIIFTSGSTGEKKGVMLSQKNLIANTRSIIQYLNLSSSDRICVVLSFYYCYGVSLLHTHIMVGGSIVLAQSIFLGSVIRSINTHQCSGFAGVPSTYQILISKTPFLSTDLSTLRYFTQAGGHLSIIISRILSQHFREKNFM